MNFTELREQAQEKMFDVSAKLAPYKKILKISAIAVVVACVGGGGAIYYYYSTQQAEMSASSASVAMYMEEEVAYGDIVVGITESGVAYLAEESVTYDYGVDVSNVQVVTGQYVYAGDLIADVVITDQDEYQEAYDDEMKSLERQLESAYTALSKAQINAEIDKLDAENQLAESLKAVEDTEAAAYIDSYEWQIDIQDYYDELEELQEEYDDVLAELYAGYDYDDFNDQLEDLEDQLEDLEEEYDDLDYDDLEDEIDDLEDDIDDLEDEIDDLEDEISALEKKIKSETDEDTLKELESELSSLESELSSLESQLESKEEQLESLEDELDDYDDKYEDLEEEIADLEEDISDLKADLYELIADWEEDLQDQLTSIQKEIDSTNTSLSLYQMNLVTKQDSEASDYASAVDTYNMAQSVYDLEMITINATLQDCYDDINDILEDIEELELDDVDESVYAPCDGYVTYIASEDSSVNANSAIVTICSQDEVEFIVSISQDDIADISIGMDVNIILDAYDEYTIPSTVREISVSSSTGMTTTVNYVVTVVCDMSDMPTMVVFDGMTGDATFVQMQVTDVLVLSSKCITNSSDGVQTVKILNDAGEAVTVEVETGFSDGFDAEITSGLEEGDIVILESAVNYAS